MHKIEFNESVDTLKFRENMTVKIPHNAVGIRYKTNDGENLDISCPENNEGRYITHFRFLFGE